MLENIKDSDKLKVCTAIYCMDCGHKFKEKYDFVNGNPTIILTSCSFQWLKENIDRIEEAFQGVRQDNPELESIVIEIATDDTKPALLPAGFPRIIGKGG